LLVLLLNLPLTLSHYLFVAQAAFLLSLLEQARTRLYEILIPRTLRLPLR
jgi:hypothetical protein